MQRVASQSVLWLTKTIMFRSQGLMPDMIPSLEIFVTLLSSRITHCFQTVMDHYCYNLSFIMMMLK